MRPGRDFNSRSPVRRRPLLLNRLGQTVFADALGAQKSSQLSGSGLIRHDECILGASARLFVSLRQFRYVPREPPGCVGPLSFGGTGDLVELVSHAVESGNIFRIARRLGRPRLLQSRHDLLSKFMYQSELFVLFLWYI